MSAISISIVHVLWTGVPTQKFRLARGIRQVGEDWGRVISDTFGFQKVKDMRYYLGVPLPLFHERVTNSTLRFVVEKSMMIPKGICEEIEHIKMSLVSWDLVCQPCCCEGLGLRKLRDTFLPELGYNIHYNKISLLRHFWGDTFLSVGINLSTYTLANSLYKSWDMHA
ncbi:hypothetical protein J1N35_022259 [Gossypium stocksii]|uniref:Uncharacterized protein n=1 Tax=Gossypium stocksii TaxID=47602 RepID=A0A9D3VGA4_9ROSI|nr:hypothetical protein J1N35_022259 [Gossypium stocksii]